MTRWIALLFLLLGCLAGAQEEWVTVSDLGEMPAQQVAPASAQWEGEDKVSFAWRVGEGAIWLELWRDKKIHMVEAGTWSNNQWMAAQKIDDEPHPVQPHMMCVWEHFFKK